MAARRTPKLLAFVKSDGIANTVSYAWNGVANSTGLRLSETYFLRCDRRIEFPRSNAQQADFRSTADPSDLEGYGFERLKNTPYREWLGNGSICTLGIVNGSLVSYCWTHQSDYFIDNALGTFRLKGDEAWIGPLFVDRRLRGRSIAAPQIDFAMRARELAGRTTFVTAISSSNYASLRAFGKSGFLVIGLSRIRRFGRWQISASVCDINSNNYLREALR